MALTRLDKLLANRTAFSRADIKKLLRAGAVQVDGIRETDGGRKLDPDVQQITCQGKPLRSSEHVYYILNKPMGVVCATEDRDHKTAYACPSWYRQLRNDRCVLREGACYE